MSRYESASLVNYRCQYHILWTPKYRLKLLKGNLGKELRKYLYLQQHEKLQGCRVERSSRSRPLGCENATKFEYFKVYGIFKRTDSDKVVQQISVSMKAEVMGQ